MLAFYGARPGAWFADTEQQLSSTLLQARNLGVKAVISTSHEKSKLATSKPLPLPCCFLGDAPYTPSVTPVGGAEKSNSANWQHLGDDTQDTLQGCRAPPRRLGGRKGLEAQGAAAWGSLAAGPGCRKGQGISEGKPFD